LEEEVVVHPSLGVEEEDPPSLEEGVEEVVHPSLGVEEVGVVVLPSSEAEEVAAAAIESINNSEK
jgi:hypothetical protein